MGMGQSIYRGSVSNNVRVGANQRVSLEQKHSAAEASIEHNHVNHPIALSALLLLFAQLVARALVFPAFPP